MYGWLISAPATSTSSLTLRRVTSGSSARRSWRPLPSLPVSPSGLDLNRISPTFEILAEIGVSHPVGVGVLLTKVRRGTRSARDARAILAEHGYPAMKTEIPLAEHFAGAFGSVPSILGQYWELLAELEQ